MSELLAGDALSDLGHHQACQQDQVEVIDTDPRHRQLPDHGRTERRGRVDRDDLGPDHAMPATERSARSRQRRHRGRRLRRSPALSGDSRMSSSTARPVATHRGGRRCQGRGRTSLSGIGAHRCRGAAPAPGRPHPAVRAPLVPRISAHRDPTAPRALSQERDRVSEHRGLAAARGATPARRLRPRGSH